MKHPDDLLSTAALIVAAGRGARAGEGAPKQYRPVARAPVLTRTLNAFLHHPAIGRVMTVIHPDDAALYAGAAPVHDALCAPVHGGDSRAESVLNGLRALKGDPPEHVLIHDAARPFISAGVIERVIAALEGAEGAVAALPAVDSMRRADVEGLIAGVVERDGVWRVQTPQGFRYPVILDALEAAARAGTLAAITDDAAAAMASGARVRVVPGDPMNFKLTAPEDFTMADRMMGAAPDIRVGQGFDVHAFGEGDAVILCGVRVPHERGLKGHSDADVGLHAVTDAILGAIAEGDIGRHFPPSDPQWKGVDSAVFLRRAIEIAQTRGYGVGNLDITLICERPKIGPHAAAMQARVAEICGIEAGRVSVKATTSERLGFTGREEGIAALASACLIGVVG